MACTFNCPCECNKRPLLKVGQFVYVVVEKFKSYKRDDGYWSARMVKEIVEAEVRFVGSDLFIVDPSIIRYPYFYKDRGITWFKTKGEARRAQRRKENER